MVVGMYHVAFLKNESWLEGMRVHPKHRKKGLGTLMMSHAEAVIKRGTVRLVIESENAASFRMVTGMGYNLEEKWRLYSTVPEKRGSGAEIAKDMAQLGGLVMSSTYADSWRWLPIDNDELQKLVRQGRAVVFSRNARTLAVGIWNKSSDFPDIFQLGYVNGAQEGVEEIFQFAKNKACEINCQRIQIFVPEGFSLKSTQLEKRSLFYLMKKELGKNL